MGRLPDSWSQGCECSLGAPHMLREFLRLTPPGSVTSSGMSPGSPVPTHGGFCGSGCGEHSVGLGAPGEDRQQEGAPGVLLPGGGLGSGLVPALAGCSLRTVLELAQRLKAPEVCAPELQKLTPRPGVRHGAVAGPPQASASGALGGPLWPFLHWTERL